MNQGKRIRRFEDEEEVRSSKRVKHARNQKGKGMRILNRYDENDYDEEELDHEIESYDEDDNTNTN
jgi:hypothetical protein